jgi:hypothetical protein
VAGLVGLRVKSVPQKDGMASGLEFSQIVDAIQRFCAWIFEYTPKSRQGGGEKFERKETNGRMSK